jgi:tetratricopeptide (TPR) repeat protein
LLEDQTSAIAVLPSVQSLVNIIDVYAGEARSQVRTQTLSLASELHTYAGWLLLDTQHDANAVQHFDTAVSLAAEADEPDHLSHAASFKGYMALKLGKFAQAVSLSKVSLRDNRTFTALRAFDGYQAGHAYARASERREAERSIHAADRLLDDVPDGPLPPWAYWYNLAFLLTQRAIAHEALGRKDLAISDLETGLAEMPPEHRNADWAREMRGMMGRLRMDG